MYQRVITPSAKKSLQKLSHDARQELLRASELLSSTPRAGEKLHGSLSFLYSFHFKYKNVQYRMAYSLDKNRELVMIHYVGSRENFYERLRRLF